MLRACASSPVVVIVVELRGAELGVGELAALCINSPK